MKFSRLLVVMVLSTTFLALLMSSLQTRASVTATFTVNSTIDAIDVNPGDGVCETAVGNSVCTLRAAVMEANANTNLDTIEIPAGTFLLSITGRSDDLSTTGDLDITNDVIINGAGYQETIIDGNKIDRVFHILGSPPPSVTISGLSIQQGYALRSIFEYGGGIYNETGAVTIVNSRVTQCEEEGIRNSDTMTITGTLIDNNIGLQIGGIHNTDYSDLTIINSTIDNNNGGILNKYDTSLRIENSSIIQNYEKGGLIQDGPNITPISVINSTVGNNHNSTSPGGGIGIYNGDDIIIENSIIKGNRSPFGGAIHFYGTVITISNTTIDSNLADGGAGSQGAGIQLLGGNLVLINSNVTNNQFSPLDGTKGGGIYLAGGSQIKNSTISQNTAGTDGGGLYLAGGTTYITNTTIVSNVSALGGGIYDQPGVFSPAVLYNSIIANNSGENCGGSDPSGSEITSLGNNIDSGNSCEFASYGDLINTEPLLGSLTWNGGVGFTHAPMEGSPAIDGGNNVNCPETDQRGASRPFDGNDDGTAVCDIGAHEFGAIINRYLYLPFVMKP